MTEFGEILLEDLYKYKLILSHNNIYKFVTCMPEYCVEPSEGEKVTVYNFFTQQHEAIAPEEVAVYLHKSFEDIAQNNILFDEVLLYVKEKVQEIKDNPRIALSDQEIYEKICRVDVLNVDVLGKNYMLDLLLSFDLVLDADDILTGNIPELKKSLLAEVFLHLILQKKGEVVKELSILKDQTVEAEDIEDIDTIIQMYEDSTQEIDFTDCANVSDFLSKWPPLLLPLPSVFDNLERVQRLGNDTTLIDFIDIVRMLNVDELKELHSDLQEINTESVDKKLTFFINYLSKRIQDLS